MTNGNQPITPIADLNKHTSYLFGLTKREYFAAMAMQGLCVSTTTKHITLLSKIKMLFGIKDWKCTNHCSEQQVAEQAVKQADELLKQLER